VTITTVIVLVFLIAFFFYTIFTKEFKLLFFVISVAIYFFVVRFAVEGTPFSLLPMIFIYVLFLFSIAMLIFFAKKEQSRKGQNTENGNAGDKKGFTGKMIRHFK